MRTVERSLDILEVVQNYKEGIGLAELAEKTGLNESTVRRFCSTLVKRKYLYQKSKRGDYFLGFKLLTFNLISNFAFIIKELARPFLNKLCDDIEESVVLTIMDGGKPFKLDNVMPRHVVQAAAPLGGEYPLYCTSSGKIHLAYMDDKIIDTTIGLQELKAHTENTITDKQKLKQEIADIRRDGVAFDDEEYITGVKSAAAPIRSENGAVVAAVSFVGLSIRVSSVKMRQLGPAVKKCADEISQALGYSPSA
jgi:IclR family KDG regulon transcriptional repressor